VFLISVKLGRTLKVLLFNNAYILHDCDIMNMLSILALTKTIAFISCANN
jgi:hypothetical protein